VVKIVSKWALLIVVCYGLYTLGYQLFPDKRKQLAFNENIIVSEGSSTNYQLVSLETTDPVEPDLIDGYATEAGPHLNTKFGLPVDSFTLVQGKIKKNEFLSEILTRYNVDYQQIDKLAKKSKDTFDVRSLNYDKAYTLLTRKKDSLEVAEYFVYEPNAYSYVVFDLTGETNVEQVRREITTELREASGIIESSLYLTMLENELDPELAYKLADVYAWTIDFYRINKGDRFRLIYEQEMIEGKPVGIGAIMATWFEHSNEDFYGFSFVQDNLNDFYDEEGKSLRKQFLKAPLKFSRISSRYSKRRFHPVQKRYKAHLGTDYAAPTGTPIRAVGDGMVTEAKYKQYNGNYVKIRHNGTYTTQYLHMSKFGKGIKSGTYVKQGDVIGYVGSTGLATGPHLCFRFWKNGVQVDPFKQKLPPSKPVKPELMNDYQLVVDEWKGKLDAIEIETPAANKVADAGDEEDLEAAVH